MEMRSNAGLTLVELLVAMTLTLTIALIATSIFVAANHMLSVNASSYLISRELELGMAELKGALKETALGTIRVTTEGPPAVSMVSSTADDWSTKLDPQGGPKWNGWTHFILQVKGEEPTGALLRWTESADNLDIPGPSLADPFDLSKASDQKVILRDVVRPGAVLTNLGEQPLELSEDGGFSVRFLRLKGGDYQPDTQNPAVYSLQGKDLAGNTRLLEVTLRTYISNEAGRADTVGVKLRIAPRF